MKVIAAEPVFAVSTDSVVVRRKLPTGEGLGGWALRGEFPDGVFFTADGHFSLTSRDREHVAVKRAFRAGEASLGIRERCFYDGRRPEVRGGPEPLQWAPVPRQPGGEPGAAGDPGPRGCGE